MFATQTFLEGGVAHHPGTNELWAISSGGQIYNFPGGVPTLQMEFSVTSLGLSGNAVDIELAAELHPGPGATSSPSRILTATSSLTSARSSSP